MRKEKFLMALLLALALLCGAALAEDSMAPDIKVYGYIGDMDIAVLDCAEALPVPSMPYISEAYKDHGEALWVLDDPEHIFSSIRYFSITSGMRDLQRLPLDSSGDTWFVAYESTNVLDANSYPQLMLTVTDSHGHTFEYSWDLITQGMTGYTVILEEDLAEGYNIIGFDAVTGEITLSCYLADGQFVTATYDPQGVLSEYRYLTANGTYASFRITGATEVFCEQDETIYPPLEMVGEAAVPAEN